MSRNYNGFVIKRNGQRVVVPFAKDGKGDGWKITPSEMLSIDEIVDDLFHGMQVDEKEAMKAEKKEELIAYHHTFGRFIRNTFCLWLPDNPNVIKDDLGKGHPDGISMIVMEKLHARLQQPEGSENYDRAMTDI